MGNHDEFLLDAELVHTYSAAPQVVASIDWTRCRLSRVELDFLRSFILASTPPEISGIGWVLELVEIAGGIDIFADRRHQGAARDRIVTAEEVVAREPDLIIGSWCGKKFRPERVTTRAGFGQVPAVRHQDLYEIKSSLILQPGPAALTDGLAELQRIIELWATRC